MKNKTWLYGCRMRPPGPGAVPRDGLIQCSYDDAPRYWGYAEYSRALTEDEISHYELDLIDVMGGEPDE